MVAKLKLKDDSETCGRSGSETVKQLLHLPVGTADDFLTLRVADGGLGLSRLADSVTKSTLKLAYRLQSADDPIIRSVAERNLSSHETRRCLRDFQLGAIERPSDINKAAERQYTDRRKAFGNTSQGRCHRHLVNNGNPWLHFGRGSLRANDFIDACKLLTEQLPTRSVVCRKAPELDQRCRGCQKEKETQKHVLQCCPTTNKRP